jgi:hypothetical protein
MLTEFGGIALDEDASDGTTWGYSSARDAEELAEMFEQLMTTVVHTALFSGFCYTQFADTFQEANGLLRADRSPKVPLARIAQSTRASRTHIPGGV